MRKVWICLAAALGLTTCRPKPGEINNTEPAWYKNEVIYNLDVKTFKDNDGNGTGDFKGLTAKLGYLDTLDVTTIWLAPFQPSPWQDDGYDVMDYFGIDPRVGTPDDFGAFLSAAKKRHIRVIMDMVLNHSSIRHPWFRSRPGWYVWSPTRPSDWDKGMGFPGVEKETWRYDSLFRKYYFHRFYRFEPDLNYQNPQVLAEAERILKYWLLKGVDGFRLDAVPFIIDDPRNSAEHPDHDFNLLHALAGYVKKVKPDAVLLGEANVKPSETKDYFSHRGEGLDMMLNFEVNEYLFYALATSHAGPLDQALKATAEKPAQDQWVCFLRNHDEIDLGKLSKHQLKQVFSRMAPDTGMQLYKRGIRRRLAPMLANNRIQLRQCYSLLFALPGTPVLRYGEEIGMGDDLHLKERLAIRTPMQWDTTVNGGFSIAKHPFRSPIMLGPYGFKAINVQYQLADSSSLLTFIRHLIRLRKAHPEIGQGHWMLMDCNNEQCMVIAYRSKGRQLMVACNFSDRPQQVTLPAQPAINLKDVVTGRQIELTGKDKKVSLSLPSYAAYWLQ